MLVLSRKIDEEVVIEVGGERIVLAVVDIRADKVRLGITARPEVTIHRREVWVAIQQEKAAAEMDNEQLIAAAHFDFPKPAVDHSECD